MLKKYYKNFKLISGVLILGLLIPVFLPFTTKTSYAYGDDYSGANGETTDTGYNPSSINSTYVQSGTSGSGSAGNNNFTQFMNGTAVSLMSTTGGCGNIASRYTNIINNMATNKNTKLSLDQVNNLVTDTANITKAVLHGIAASQDDKDSKLNTYLNKLDGGNGTSNSNVTDKGSKDELAKINEKLQAQLKLANENKVWEQCLNGIAYKVAKQQLASMTNSIVKWVNTGFGGDPLFIRDRDSFFKKIGTDSLQTFLTPLTDPTLSSLYPYGKDVARILIKSSNSTFESRAQSTLSDSLPSGVTSKDYLKDFSKGGWKAWISQTQNPANNPLGFAMIAKQEASDRAAKAQQAKQDELNQGKGFLSVTKCVEYKKKETITGASTIVRDTLPKAPVGVIGYLSDNVELSSTGFDMVLHYDAPSIGKLKTILTTDAGTLVVPARDVATFSNTALLSDVIHVSYDNLTANTKYVLIYTFESSTSALEQDNGDAAQFSISLSPTQTPVVSNLDSDCLRKEVVTPGSIVAEQVSTVTTSPIRQLEIANTVNQSLDSVFAAMVNQLTTNGFSSLSNYSYKRTSTGTVTGIQYYDAGKNLITVNSGYGGWYNQGGDFDITKDLGDIYTKDRNGNLVAVKNGIISTQKEYIQAAKATKKSLIPILTTLGDLDYCIPGPNPDWKNVTNQRVSDIQDYLSGQVFGGDNLNIKPRWANASKSTASVSAVAAFFVPVGTIIAAVVAVGAAIFDAIQSGKNEKMKAKLAANKTYSEEMFYKNIQTQSDGINGNYDAYTKYINGRYGNLNNQLAMSADGMELTKNITTYAANIEQSNTEYDSQINTVNTNIIKLNAIKSKVDAIVKAARADRQAKVNALKAKAGFGNTVNFCPGVDPTTDATYIVNDNTSSLGGDNGTGIN